MSRFRKKPVEIEARQLRNDNAGEIAMWCFGTVRGGPKGGSKGGTVLIDTLEGVMTAQPGDWIIEGVHGEFYPCKGDIFELTYEPVDVASPTPTGPERCAECDGTGTVYLDSDGDECSEADRRAEVACPHCLGPATPTEPPEERP